MMFGKPVLGMRMPGSAPVWESATRAYRVPPPGGFSMGQAQGAALPSEVQAFIGVALSAAETSFSLYASKQGVSTAKVTGFRTRIDDCVGKAMKAYNDAGQSAIIAGIDLADAAVCLYGVKRDLDRAIDEADQPVVDQHLPPAVQPNYLVPVLIGGGSILAIVLGLKIGGVI